MKHTAGNEPPAEGRLAKAPNWKDRSEKVASPAAGCAEGTGATTWPARPCPGTAEGDVKFLEGARRGPGDPLQREEARGEARVAPSAGRGRRRPGGAQARRALGSCGLGAEQRPVREPSRPAQASPPDRSPRRARGSRGAATRPPATHQDALEEVALLGRQLHVRHRGRRGGWVARLSVPREWAATRDAAKSRGRAMGQFIGLELGLGSLGRAGGGKGTRSQRDTLRSRPAPQRAAAGPARCKMATRAHPREGATCACAGRPGGRGRGRPGRTVLMGAVALSPERQRQVGLMHCGPPIRRWLVSVL